MLALALINPSLVQEKREPIKDVAVVVLDASPSQNIGDRRARAEAELERLAERLKLRRSGAAGGPRRGRGIRCLGHQRNAPVRRAEPRHGRRAPPPHGRAVLITDGQVHDVPENLARLAEIGPVHTLLTGNRDEGDRRLAIVQAPAYGLVGNRWN
ncbi:hypothetical protein [Azospirillum brasilense]|uniref:hypothetical protein n=1 Tax=Azospirillum brasilense TaxID=192 RepID=UPI001FE62C83|nr:hypothetical protein [Azospirillum brasilense]